MTPASAAKAATLTPFAAMPTVTLTRRLAFAVTQWHGHGVLVGDAEASKDHVDDAVAVAELVAVPVPVLVLDIDTDVEAVSDVDTDCDAVRD